MPTVWTEKPDQRRLITRQMMITSRMMTSSPIRPMPVPAMANGIAAAGMR